MNAQWESAPWNRQHEQHDHLAPKIVVSRTVSLVTFSALLALALVGGRPAAAAHPGASESAPSASSSSTSGGGGSSSHESYSSSSGSSSGGGSSSHEGASSSSSSNGGASSARESGSSASGGGGSSSGSHASGSSGSGGASGGGGAAAHDAGASGRGSSSPGPATPRDLPARSPRVTDGELPAPAAPSGASPRAARGSSQPAGPAQRKPAAGGQTPAVVRSGGRGDERNPPELEPRLPHKPGRPPGPPISGQPRPPAHSGDGPFDPGVFYVYDNTEPESSYLAGEPCRIVCQSDPSVQCSSYAGDCQGLPDRLICDGQTFLCPGTEVSDASDAPEQPAVQDQAAQLDQAGHTTCEAREDRQLDGSHGRECGREHDRHAGRHQGSGRGCPQGQPTAEGSCSGANASP
jgi:hypothetical protein